MLKLLHAIIYPGVVDMLSHNVEPLDEYCVTLARLMLSGVVHIVPGANSVRLAVEEHSLQWPRQFYP